MTNNDFNEMTTKGDNKYKSIYYLKPRMKVGEIPYFQVKTKDASGQYIEVTDRLITKISGECIMVESSKYVYENQEIKTVKIYLTKNETLCVITMSYTTATCSFINSLINLPEKPRTISINLSQDKNGYNKMWVLFDEKIVTWKYSVDEIKTYIDSTTLNKKVITDNTRLHEMLEHELVMFVNNHYLGGTIEKNASNELFDENEHGIPLSEETDVDDFFAGTAPYEPPAGSNTSKTKKK